VCIGVTIQDGVGLGVMMGLIAVLLAGISNVLELKGRRDAQVVSVPAVRSRGALSPIRDPKVAAEGSRSLDD
jgi:hypothetical protein